MNELALFAGAGGGILGGNLLGWRTVAAVEIEDYPRRILLQRQADGILPRFPIWDDVCTFDGRPWRGKVDVISGGFPCQDISVAGTGKGLDGARSGLWAEMRRIIGEVRPSYILVENSPALTFRGLDRVLADLTALGYDARWGIIGASDVGALHRRERIWIVANSDQVGQRGLFTWYGEKKGEWAKKAKRSANRFVSKMGLTRKAIPNQGEDKPSPNGVVDGLANWMDRTHAIGNGQVPAVVRRAWEVLNGER